MTVKVAIAQINSTLGDLSANRALILDYARRAHAAGADIMLTPELSLTGYPPEDLLLRSAFYTKTAQALAALQADLASLTDLYVIVGHPWQQNGRYFNAASVLVNGESIGIPDISGSNNPGSNNPSSNNPSSNNPYCKHDLPNTAVFDEMRYFSAADQPLVFNVKGVNFGLAICEDTWFPHVSERARAAGAQVLLIPNGSPFHMNKQDLRYEVMRTNVCAQGLSLVYANLVGGQDELIFDGASFVLDASGALCLQMPQFVADMRYVVFDGGQPCAESSELSESSAAVCAPVCIPLSLEAQVYQALVLGVRDYVNKNGFPGAILGMSGGVDSALTLAIAVDALGADRVRAVMMPSKYTAEISWIDSREMVQRLGVRYDEIPISDCFQAFRQTLAQEFANLKEDTTEENLQARIRGTILMAISNKHGSIVLTTGNKSEMAVGYCTLYGDMAGGFAVIKDIAKTLVYRLCDYRNQVSEVIPTRILTRAPSAELRPDQCDQDSLPPYEVLDAIMQMYMEENQPVEAILAAGFKREDVQRVTRLIQLSEYKRRQAPIGIRVTHRGFGRDWRYPITSRFSEF